MFLCIAKEAKMCKGDSFRGTTSERLSILAAIVTCMAVCCVFMSFPWSWPSDKRGITWIPYCIVFLKPSWHWIWRLMWETSNTYAPIPRSKWQKISSAIAIELHSKFERGEKVVGVVVNSGLGLLSCLKPFNAPIGCLDCCHMPHSFSIVADSKFELPIIALWGDFLKAWGWWPTIAQLWWKHYFKNETHAFCDLQMLVHLNRTSRPSMLLVKVIREPFYHSCPPGSLAAGCILLT